MQIASFYKFKATTDSRFGRGNVATAPIIDGEIICKMIGPLMNLKEICIKYGINGANPLQIDKDTYIDLIEPYVIFNHSCNPNAGIRNDGILFALRDIAVGEEIFYDYSTTSDDLLWEMECGCNAQNCRQLITDFQSIPHEQKNFYLSKNAITSYLKKIYY